MTTAMMPRVLGLITILFVGGACSYADSNCSVLPKTETASTDFAAKEAALKEREAQANHDYENAKLLCEADESPRGCLMAAQTNYQNEQISIAENRNRNDAARTKASIDIESAKDECNVTGETPAVLQENRRHYEALIAIKKQGVDVETTYKNAILDCRTRESHPSESGGAKSSDQPGNYNYSNQGSGCSTEAEKDYAKAKARLQVATNDENFTHDKNLAAIRAGKTLPKP